MALTGNASEYLQNQILNWMKGTTFASAPATTYVGLYTTAPTDSNNTGSTEVSGNAYARQAITSSSGWSSISGEPSSPAQISNAATITFPTPSGNWGTILAIGIFDASTSGNLLWWNTITSQTVNTGVVASFAIGALIITMD